MKLQSVHNGHIYVTQGRQLYRSVGGIRAEDQTISAEIGTLDTIVDSQFEYIGSLPLCSKRRSGLKERFLTKKPWKDVLKVIVGYYQTHNLWVFSSSDMLATVGRNVFYSETGGRTWEHSLSLPSSSPLMGTHPSNVNRSEGRIYLGEYPLNNSNTPRVYLSTDRGKTWQTHLQFKDVRHIHSVQADPYDGDLWVTTGDRNEACQLLRIHNGDTRVVGSGNQDWRIVEPVFTRTAVIWGVDCGYAEEVKIFKLPRSEIGTDSPTPEQVGETGSSVYYSARCDIAGTETVFLSTAAECGSDSTAPQAKAFDNRETAVLTASEETGFREWTTIAKFARRNLLADMRYMPDQMPVTNAYIMLATHPEHGLFINPLNTSTGSGSIYRVPTSLLTA